MPITPASYDSNSDPLVHENFGDQVDAAHAWLNGGLVTTDLADDAIVRDHVTRPAFRGSPVYGMEGRIHKVRQHVADRAAGAPMDGQTLEFRRDRDSLQPFSFTDSTDNTWLTRFGRTVDLPTTCHVEIWCHGTVHTSKTGANWEQPWVTSTGDRFGRMVIGCFDRSDLQAGIALMQSTSHELRLPSQNTIGSEHFSMRTLTSLSAGKYDILLVYDRQSLSPAHSDGFQIDLRAVCFGLDAFPIATP